MMTLNNPQKKLYQKYTNIPVSACPPGLNLSSQRAKFDKKKFLLAGWASSDRYNNKITFEIEIISVNQMINNNVFALPGKG